MRKNTSFRLPPHYGKRITKTIEEGVYLVKMGVQIMRISMTTLTQIWMTFLLSNILLSDHNSDLTLPKCQLVYNIMMHISVHVAQLILNSIHQFVGISPPKHPVDPEKSNRVLGFPALIIGLCQFYGVPVATTKLIWPPIKKTFNEKYCKPR